MALKMPQIQKLMKKFSYRTNKELILFKFAKWRDNILRVREAYLKKVELQTKLALILQKYSRGYFGRRRYSRLKQSFLLRLPLKKKYSMIQIQCLVLIWLQRRRIKRLLTANKGEPLDCAAVLIQKHFRNFLVVKKLVNAEKVKLVKQLRSWSHGITSDLFNVKGWL